jgi:hypothetical protein
MRSKSNAPSSAPKNSSSKKTTREVRVEQKLNAQLRGTRVLLRRVVPHQTCDPVAASMAAFQSLMHIAANQEVWMQTPEGQEWIRTIDEASKKRSVPEPPEPFSLFSFSATEEDKKKFFEEHRRKHQYESPPDSHPGGYCG